MQTFINKYIDERHRPETALAIENLASRIANDTFARFNLKKSAHGNGNIKILDLCTGTGCMSLLLRHELLGRFSNSTHLPHASCSSRRTDDDDDDAVVDTAVPGQHQQRQPGKQPPNIQTLGIDSSPRAVKLARKNVRLLIPDAQERGDVRFQLGDVLASECSSSSCSSSYRDEEFDVVVANPPYISPRSYWSSDVAKSVRAFEPRNALVPPSIPSPPSPIHASGNEASAPHDGNGRAESGREANTDTERADLFYPCIIDTAIRVHAKVLLMEVADMSQALRVAGMVLAGEGGEGDGVGVGWCGGVRGGGGIGRGNGSTGGSGKVSTGGGGSERGGRGASRYFNDVEIWRDDPFSGCAKESEVRVRGRGHGDGDGDGGSGATVSVRVTGSGNGRSVVCWR
ncbi:MAG: hypothetical protein M1831_004613 [Alyxoria varia]|nr:MAG: hypothetical protein M1831_004613 [Alyxoria varia]